MSDSSIADATATIRLIGQEMENCEVPIEILVRVLAGFQQIVYLLATTQEKKTVGQRFRVSREVQQLYSLRASIPQQGSYTLPLVLKPQFGSQLSVWGKYESIIENIEKFLSCLNTSDLSNLQDIFPDSKLRNRALFEARRFLPKADERWGLGFSRNGSDEFTLTNNAITHIDDWLTQDTPEDAVMTVTGELIRIDFDKRIVVLRYSPTHKEIECIYLEELEDSMIENRRQKIQVTGQFTLDADGHPIKLTDVTRIEPVDLSPIVIREIPLHNKKLRLKTPLSLTPKMDDDTEQLYVVENPDISLHVFSYTREDLIHEINEQLAMLWEEYAVTTDELTTDAHQLQRKLIEILEEVEKPYRKSAANFRERLRIPAQDCDRDQKNLWLIPTRFSKPL